MELHVLAAGWAPCRRGARPPHVLCLCLAPCCLQPGFAGSSCATDFAEKTKIAAGGKPNIKTATNVSVGECW